MYLLYYFFWVHPFKNTHMGRSLALPKLTDICYYILLCHCLLLPLSVPCEFFQSTFLVAFSLHCTYHHGPDDVSLIIQFTGLLVVHLFSVLEVIVKFCEVNQLAGFTGLLVVHWLSSLEVILKFCEVSQFGGVYSTPSSPLAICSWGHCEILWG